MAWGRAAGARAAGAGAGALLLPLARPLAAGAVALGPRCARPPRTPSKPPRPAVPRPRPGSLGVPAVPWGSRRPAWALIRGSGVGVGRGRGQAWVDAAQGGLGGGAGDLGDAVYPVFGVGAALYGLFLLREETTSWGKGGGSADGVSTEPPPGPAALEEDGEGESVATEPEAASEEG